MSRLERNGDGLRLIWHVLVAAIRITVSRPCRTVAMREFIKGRQAYLEKLRAAKALAAEQKEVSLG